MNFLIYDLKLIFKLNSIRRALHIAPQSFSNGKSVGRLKWLSYIWRIAKLVATFAMAIGLVLFFFFFLHFRILFPSETTQIFQVCIHTAKAKREREREKVFFKKIKRAACPLLVEMSTIFPSVHNLMDTHPCFCTP